MVPISLQHGTQSFILPCRLGPVFLLPSALSLLDLFFLVFLHLLLPRHSDCNHPFQRWEGRRPCLKEKKGAISGMGGRLNGTSLGFSLPWKTWSYCLQPRGSHSLLEPGKSPSPTLQDMQYLLRKAGSTLSSVVSWA